MKRIKKFRKISLNDRKKIAEERIEILSRLAEREPAYSERYEELIRKIARKYGINPKRQDK